MIVFFNQILLVFSLYDLRCIILTIGKQIIAFKKGTFAPPAPPTERQEERILSPAHLSSVPVYDNNVLVKAMYVKVLKEGESKYEVVAFFFYS